MKTKLILLIFIVLCSCNKNKNNLQKNEEVVYAKSVMYEMASPPPPPIVIERSEYVQTKLIKTGRLKIISKDIESTKNKLNNILDICKGTITYESFTKYEEEASYSLLYDVPVYNFDKFVKLLDSLNLNITEKVYRVTDVTLRHVDETSRLNNKRKLEKTYLDLLGKANKIEDIIEVQRNIEEIRADIESREEQLKSLNNQIAFSKFDIKVEKPKAKKTNNSDRSEDNTEKFSEALVTGLNGIIVSLVFLLSIWPIYIIIVILFLVFRLYRKKNKK